MKLLNWLKFPFKLKRECEKLKCECEKITHAWAVERSVLIDEITRNKHILGVYRQMFSNIDTFNNTFAMMQSSLAKLLTQATKNSDYAVVAEVEMVKVEHLMFKLHMYKRFIYLQDMSELESKFKSPFGAWYYGEGQKLAHLEEFKEIDGYYTEMYGFASEALTYLRECEYILGVEKVAKMEQCSVKIVDLLEAIANHLLADVKEQPTESSK